MQNSPTSLLLQLRGAHFDQCVVKYLVMNCVVYHAKLSTESEVNWKMVSPTPLFALLRALRGTLRQWILKISFSYKCGLPREALHRERSVVEMPGIEPGSNVYEWSLYDHGSFNSHSLSERNKDKG